jgi:hypothetical protein
MISAQQMGNIFIVEHARCEENNLLILLFYFSSSAFIFFVKDFSLRLVAFCSKMGKFDANFSMLARLITYDIILRALMPLMCLNGNSNFTSAMLTAFFFTRSTRALLTSIHFN